MDLEWRSAIDGVDWEELAELYRIAPLGEKDPADLRIAFANSRFPCFVFTVGRLIGAGRVLSDGVDCAYIADVAVHPAYQGRGIGRAIVTSLVDRSQGHRKIILYAAPGKEGLYQKLGFRRMRTAMAIFQNQDQAQARGLIDEGL